MFTTVTKALLVIAAVCASEASPPVEDGSFWSDGGASAVYVEIADYTQPGPGKFTLRPLATLSGRLDPAIESDIVANTNIVGIIGGGLIREAPPKGAKAIVLLCRRSQNGRDHYWIPSSNVACFPRCQQQPFPDARPAIIEVTGFDDPKVTETIENLRKLRGKQREEAEQKAAAGKNGIEKKDAGNTSTGKNSPPVNPPAN
jgi:hypothetical protein